MMETAGFERVGYRNLNADAQADLTDGADSPSDD